MDTKQAKNALPNTTPPSPGALRKPLDMDTPIGGLGGNLKAKKKENVFDVTNAFENPHSETGVIVSDKRRSGPSIGESFLSAISEWWGEPNTTEPRVEPKIQKVSPPPHVGIQKNTLRKAEVIIQKPVIAGKIERKSEDKNNVKEKPETTHSPHHIVVEKTRTLAKDIARLTEKKTDVTGVGEKNIEKEKAPSHQKTTSPKTTQTGPLIVPDVRTSTIAPLVRERIEIPKGPVQKVVSKETVRAERVSIPQATFKSNTKKSGFLWWKSKDVLPNYGTGNEPSSPTGEKPSQQSTENVTRGYEQEVDTPTQPTEVVNVPKVVPPAEYSPEPQKIDAPVPEVIPVEPIPAQPVLAPLPPIAPALDKELGVLTSSIVEPERVDIPKVTPPPERPTERERTTTPIPKMPVIESVPVQPVSVPVPVPPIPHAPEQVMDQKPEAPTQPIEVVDVPKVVPSIVEPVPVSFKPPKVFTQTPPNVLREPVKHDDIFTKKESIVDTTLTDELPALEDKLEFRSTLDQTLLERRKSEVLESQRRSAQVTRTWVSVLQETSTSWMALFVLVLLGAIVAIVASVYIQMSQRIDETVATPIVIPSFFETEAQTTVALSGDGSLFLTTLTEYVGAAKPGVIQLYPTILENGVERPVTSHEFFTTIHAALDEGAVRTLDDTIMMGSVTTSANEPYLILRTNDFDTLFSSFLMWEQSMKSDLSPLFGELPSSHKAFIDSVWDNRSTRILKGAEGQTTLLYSFVDQNTVVITQSEEALSLLLEKF